MPLTHIEENTHRHVSVHTGFQIAFPCIQSLNLGEHIRVFVVGVVGGVLVLVCGVCVLKCCHSCDSFRRYRVVNIKDAVLGCSVSMCDSFHNLFRCVRIHAFHVYSPYIFVYIDMYLKKKFLPMPANGPLVISKTFR